MGYAMRVARFTGSTYEYSGRRVLLEGQCFDADPFCVWSASGWKFGYSWEGKFNHNTIQEGMSRKTHHFVVDEVSIAANLSAFMYNRAW